MSTRHHNAMLVGLLVVCAGCFSERSIRLHQGDRVLLTESDFPSAPGPSFSTRDWMAAANKRLEPLLKNQIRPLVTEELSNEQGVPRDVFAHFEWERDMLSSLTGNIYGILDTAQAVGGGTGPPINVPSWEGFDEVEINVAEGVNVVARVGWATGGDSPCRANAIVILPGLLGDNRILRTRDLAMALRESGFHVLALEQRGHGQTQLRYPDQGYTFGVLETGDLIRISEWLEAHDHVLETGLVGYCWGANVGLVMAWYDGAAGVHPAVSPELRKSLPGPLSRLHYRAGILAISPVVRFEDLMDDLDADEADPTNPVLGYIHRTVKNRMVLRGYPNPSGSLWRLTDLECEQAGFSPQTTQEGLDFLRLWPYRGKPAYDKLEHARVPVLILHASNDPFSISQYVADLISTVQNPWVAACITANGGHGGFGAHHRGYYFSLILNFFDPKVGAAARIRP